MSNCIHYLILEVPKNAEWLHTFAVTFQLGYLLFSQEKPKKSEPELLQALISIMGFEVEIQVPWVSMILAGWGLSLEDVFKAYQNLLWNNRAWVFWSALIIPSSTFSCFLTWYWVYLVIFLYLCVSCLFLLNLSRYQQDWLFCRNKEAKCMHLGSCIRPCLRLMSQLILYKILTLGLFNFSV